MLQYAAGKYVLAVTTSKSAYLDMMRQSALEMARRHSPDYILWLDADQTYPMETPEILMKHIDSGKLVVGGLTPHRESGAPMAYSIKDDLSIEDRTDVKPYSGLKKVDGMGFGGVMINPKVFDTLDDTCLQSSWHPKYKTKIGEDVTFYKNCKDHNIGVWCDTGLCFEHVVVTSLRFHKQKPKLVIP